MQICRVTILDQAHVLVLQCSGTIFAKDLDMLSTGHVQEGMLVAGAQL